MIHHSKKNQVTNPHVRMMFRITVQRTRIQEPFLPNTLVTRAGWHSDVRI
jgi:hypothetical protein